VASAGVYLNPDTGRFNRLDPWGHLTLLELTLYTGIAAIATYGLSVGLRHLGVSASITDRIEGFSRILNGITLALTAWRFVNPAWIGAGFVAALDEIVVGVNQMTNGGRPPSQGIANPGTPTDFSQLQTRWSQRPSAPGPHWKWETPPFQFGRNLRNGVDIRPTEPQELAALLSPEICRTITRRLGRE